MLVTAHTTIGVGMSLASWLKRIKNQARGRAVQTASWMAQAMPPCSMDAHDSSRGTHHAAIFQRGLMREFLPCLSSVHF